MATSDRDPAAPAVPDPVLAAAAVAKLYMLAAIDEAIMTLVRIRQRYVDDLSADPPFAILLAADERLRAVPPEQRQYVEAMRWAGPSRRQRRSRP